MTRERLELGKRGEELALRTLKRLGYTCIARNYRCALGEVDLIAKDGDTLVFIETKTRKGGAWPTPRRPLTQGRDGSSQRWRSRL